MKYLTTIGLFALLCFSTPYLRLLWVVAAEIRMFYKIDGLVLPLIWSEIFLTLGLLYCLISTIENLLCRK